MFVWHTPHAQSRAEIIGGLICGRWLLTCGWHLRSVVCVVQVLSVLVLHLWYKERYSEPRPPQRVARSAHRRTRSRRPAEAFALRLLALKRKEMRPALNPALPSLRVSTPRSSYHYTQRLYTTCIFAQVMTQHAHSSELFSDVCLSVLTASIKSGI